MFGREMQFQVSDWAVLHGDGNGLGPKNMGSIWAVDMGKDCIPERMSNIIKNDNDDDDVVIMFQSTNSGMKLFSLFSINQLKIPILN